MDIDAISKSSICVGISPYVQALTSIRGNVRTPTFLRHYGVLTLPALQERIIVLLA